MYQGSAIFPCKESVVGSIPTVSTTYKTGLLVQWLGCITVYDVVRVRFPHRPQLMIITWVVPHFATVIIRVRRNRGGRDYSDSNTRVSYNG
jgi:hypothetical protein